MVEPSLSLSAYKAEGLGPAGDTPSPDLIHLQAFQVAETALFALASGPTSVLLRHKGSFLSVTNAV